VVFGRTNQGGCRQHRVVFHGPLIITTGWAEAWQAHPSLPSAPVSVLLLHPVDEALRHLALDDRGRVHLRLSDRQPGCRISIRGASPDPYRRVHDAGSGSHISTYGAGEWGCICCCRWSWDGNFFQFGENPYAARRLEVASPPGFVWPSLSELSPFSLIGFFKKNVAGMISVPATGSNRHVQVDPSKADFNALKTRLEVAGRGSTSRCRRGCSS